MKKIILLLLFVTSFGFATVPPINDPSPYVLCSDENGMGFFYLELKNNEILNGLSPDDYTVSYHVTLADAQNGTAQLFSPYVAFSFQMIWVRVVENATGDFATTSLMLILNLTPQVNLNVPNLVVYESPSDGIAVFDLQLQQNLIANGVAASITYHLSAFDAQVQVNAINNPSSFTGNDLQTIYVAVNNGSGCPAFTSFMLRVFDSANVIVFPDANFKAKLVDTNPSNFVATIGGNYVNVDTNGDGEIQFTEAAIIDELNVSNANIGDLTGVQYFTSLTFLNCSHNHITTLDLTGIPTLEHVACNENNMTSLSVNGLSNLKVLDCQVNELPSLDLTGLAALEDLNCRFNDLTVLNTVPLTAIKKVDCSSNLLASLSFSDLAQLEHLQCGSNALNTFNLNNLPALNKLEMKFTNTPSLDLTAFPALKYVDCVEGHLSSLNVTGLTNLEELYCGFNPLTTINISTLPNLKKLNCNSNQLTTLDLSANNHIDNLDCGTNSLQTLDISNLSQLVYFSCMSNQITNITVGNHPVLDSFSCDFNQLTTLNTTNMPNLFNLHCSFNDITALDLSQNLNLGMLAATFTSLTTLDLSANNNLISLSVFNNAVLETLLIKNGRNELNADSLLNCPNLNYICADQSQIAAINATNPSVTVNTFCSFTPGGNYNTITGTATYDFNNNGCDPLDIPAPFIGLGVSLDAVATNQAVFTNNAGVYNLYTSTPGVYQLTPTIENAAYFNITPVGVLADPIDNSTVTHNICITPNGNHPDIEVVLAPITPARPGFDAAYEIVYKNKGNQVQSGTVTFTYNDAVLDLVSAVVAPASASTGLITWNYSNLLPFEHRSIGFVLNVNSPLESPAVNNGNILDFTVSITPLSGDEAPADNTFALHQTVVGSFDPNDITCLEGDVVSPSEIGNYLHYIVNFENTGTFYAENVVVQDIINTAQYDIASLQILNASHNMVARVDGNKVEFIFENINLAAAAGNPPVGGHGNVLFKIKSKSDLVANDHVSKMAKIYFDYNAPIDTNPAQTVFQMLNNSVSEFDNSIVVFPNPSNGILNITSNNMIESYELYDVQGRILEKSFENTNSMTVDISARQTGVYFLKITSEKGSKIEKIVRN